MLSKQVLSVARTRSASRYALSISASRLRKAQFHASRLLQGETIKVPQMAESISEGTLRSWSKQVGDSVAADEEVATIETDKIDVSVNAPKAGKIVELLAKEDDTVTVGQDLFVIEFGEGGESSSSGGEEKKEESKEEPKEQKLEKDTSDKSEPSGQQVDKKLPDAPKPESKDGVEKQDTSPPSSKPSSGESKGKKEAAPPKKEEKKDDAPPPPASAPGSRNETRVKMNRMRLRISERLKQSQNTAASLTTFNEIDMSSLMSLRSQYKESILKQHDVKLGFMGLFAKACTQALKEIPVANASIEGDEIVYRDYVDLSVAVATPKGLVTPVVRNAESMTVLDVEKEITRLGKKARDGKLTLEDMAGGTFTISNGGVFGSLYGTPIINLPQAAVLGMHSIKERPVVVNGQIVIRPIMVVALTYDHRLLDGREAVQFLVKVKEYIEDPRKMLLI
ncbi:dihydrolipoamide succinyltransferase [Sistotremastrum niveocremeum HHB9708]|uniref:dihydrolipoyllysine-residue succinyltransferase n=2 Tax=Sistotremastraceae TaxID=3402574 RepID=A0A164N2B8_9AGAM|nr:dihydrolipoamide succinyltransferase [Sistotremastrum niveocremeum HHB9708]KZT35373.1 dihydrolipoamide succinyltransferase [Sistotremastrum suecicum HHB10207 ss-3]